MKTRLTLLKLTIILRATFVTTTAFGQTLTWTNLVMGGITGNGSNIGVTTNWSGGSPLSGTILTWDGTVPGPLVLASSDGVDHEGGGGVGPIGGSFGSAGINIHITSSQTNPVQIVSTVPIAVTIGLNTITVDSGAGQLTLGDNSANDLDFTMRPSGATHDFVNNSAHPVIICPNVSWQAGGGAAYTLIFDGTVDWGVTNNLTDETSVSLAMVGSGTLTWSGPSLPFSRRFGPIASPVIINSGTLILKTNGLLANQNITNNGAVSATIIYDGNAPQTLGGVISGPISLTVKSGTLTLSGASTFTGGTTNLGGELFLNHAENAGLSGPLGVGGTISFTGGTLGWTVNNGFDYSSRFDTSAGQAYSFDTGGQNVTLGTGLGSSGSTLTKSGNGTLTLAGTSTYSGLTTVSAGKLVFQGSKTGTGNISVADGAALGVNVTGTQVTPAALTVGTSSGATLEFNSVSSTTTALIVAGTILSAGKVTINVNSGTFTVGSSYPLLKWASGSTPTFSLGILNGFGGNLSIGPGDPTLLLNITSVAPPPTITATVSGGQVNLSWPAAWTGLHLQVQTNTLANGLGTNWVTIPGTDAANGYTNMLITTNGSVFFRLSP